MQNIILLDSRKAIIRTYWVNFRNTQHIYDKYVKYNLYKNSLTIKIILDIIDYLDIIREFKVIKHIYIQHLLNHKLCLCFFSQINICASVFVATFCSALVNSD